MIIEFSVENFRSIKDLQVLSMSAANIVSKYKEIDETNVIHKSSPLLKSKAIYGANASGKSNLIKAFSSFINIVKNSVKDEQSLRVNIDSFKFSTKTRFESTYFQIRFLLNGVPYRYGFEATFKEITAEWLFGTPGDRETYYFTRENNDIKVNESQFKEAVQLKDLYKQSENDIARTNALFLSTVRSFGGSVAKSIVNYFSQYIIVASLSDYRLELNAQKSLEDPEMKRRMSEFLKMADIGIEEIDLVEMQNSTKVDKANKEYFTITKHKNFNEELEQVGVENLYMSIGESEGSRKMFQLSPLIIEALQDNKVIIIDELDARFHPLLTKKIVEIFNSISNIGAQLIFATHNSHLLSAKSLRRDQVSFVEKDKYGASHLYSLVEFKGVRNDSSFEKDYISGKYGAIPFLGNFNNLIEE